MLTPWVVKTDCCECDHDREIGLYVVCSSCYGKGSRCENTDHKEPMLVRYIGHGFESVEEFCPWVKLLTRPKDLGNN